eukprot:1137281-Pelagomonas_calceolata.AAC.5
MAPFFNHIQGAAPCPSTAHAFIYCVQHCDLVTAAHLHCLALQGISKHCPPFSKGPAAYLWPSCARGPHPPSPHCIKTRCFKVVYARAHIQYTQWDK